MKILGRKGCLLFFLDCIENVGIYNGEIDVILDIICSFLFFVLDYFY